LTNPWAGMRWADGWPLEHRDGLPVAGPATGLVVQETDGRIVGANETACALLGMSWPQLLGVRSTDPRWAALDEHGVALDGAAHPSMVTARSGVAVADFVMGVVVPGPEGDTTTWISVSSHPLRANDDGSVLAVATTFTDATTTSRGRAATNRVISAYRTVAENASDVVIRTTPDSRLEWVSPSVTSVLGWSAHDLNGTPWLHLVHPDHRPQTEARSAGPDAGHATAFRGRMRCADDSYRWIDVQVRPVRDSRGEVVATVGGLRDVQEQVEVEHALARSEARYRLISENATDLVIQTAPDRRVTWVAPTVTATLGWEPDELVGMRVSDLLHPEDAAGIGAEVDDLYRPGATARSGFLVRMRGKDGSYLWMDGRATPSMDADSRVVAVVAALRDVDDLVRTRQQAQTDRVHLQATLDSLLDPHVLLLSVRDGSGRVIDFEYTYANDAACADLAVPRAELMGARLLDVMSGHSAAALVEMCAHVVETGEPLSLDDFPHVRRAAPGERYYDIRAVRVDDSLSYTWREVTARQAAAQRLADSERAFRLLADNTMDLVFAVTVEGLLQWMSPSVSTVLGFRPEDLVGEDSSVLMRPEDAELAMRMAHEVALGHTPTYRVRFRTSSGPDKWMEVSPRALRDERGTYIGRVVAVRDVDEQVRASLALEQEIDFDALTGLAKRPLALVRVQEILDTRTSRGCALLCVGVNGMTAINQAYTFAAGDDVLREVARRLVAARGAHDRVARTTGDAFAVLLRDIDTPDDAAAAAEWLLAAVRGPVDIDGHSVEVTACAGIAMAGYRHGGEDEDAESLLRDATAAMHQAHAKGPHRWEFLDGNIAAASRRSLDVQAQLREALTGDGIRPWFMPITDLATGQLRGYEALVRWVGADGSVTTPDQFLDVAERTDLILRIDRTVLAQSVDVLAKLPAPVHLAVNVSAATLASGYLERAVRDELLRSGADPGRLHLEVTETALFHMTDDVDRSMRALTDLGITWWVDDFGTGYSSISHLRDLRIDGLKLDRSFTSSIASGDDHSIRIAQGLVGLAAGLGLITVAEGVETTAQAEILAAQGWQLGQGWLYGKPSPLDP
jgi:PAS domain S-box-containing protein/diguanylate cyclase (GGDEF)-like protein